LLLRLLCLYLLLLLRKQMRYMCLKLCLSVHKLCLAISQFNVILLQPLQGCHQFHLSLLDFYLPMSQLNVTLMLLMLQLHQITHYFSLHLFLTQLSRAEDSALQTIEFL